MDVRWRARVNVSARIAGAVDHRSMRGEAVIVCRPSDRREAAIWLGGGRWIGW